MTLGRSEELPFLLQQKARIGFLAESVGDYRERRAVARIEEHAITDI